MNHDFCRTVLVTALLPLAMGGCAVQGGATAESTAPAVTPQVVATAPKPESPAAQPAMHKMQLPPPSALEIEYGIQITQVGLAAQGGLVDVRFKVLDAKKASKLLGNAANAPMLIAGNEPPLHAPGHALHGAKFGDGAVYFILYPNARNAIKPGTEVVVAMGDVRLGPVKVQ